MVANSVATVLANTDKHGRVIGINVTHFVSSRFIGLCRFDDESRQFDCQSPALFRGVGNERVIGDKRDGHHSPFERWVMGSEADEYIGTQRRICSPQNCWFSADRAICRAPLFVSNRLVSEQIVLHFF